MLTVEEIKNKCKDVFENYDYIKQAFLFGSYARNEATDKSDVDVLICLSRFVGWDYFSLYDKLEDAFGKRVDLITEKEMIADPGLLKQIGKDKVIIYEQ